MPATEWSTVFHPARRAREQANPADQPCRSMITLTVAAAGVQAHAHSRIGRPRLRHIEVASIPIAGLRGDFLGAAALFWELSA